MFIDLKYLNRICNSFEKYSVKQQNPFLANVRCSLCGDSKKNKNKMRGYFYTRKNSLYYKCHNCGASCSFGSFLKKFNHSIYEEYRMERFREGLDLHRKPHSKPEPKFDFTPKFKDKDFCEQHCHRLDNLDETYRAYVYALNRMIPREKFSSLYYVDDMKVFESINEKYKGKFNESEERLVIPFYGDSGALLGVSCRALDASALKYIAIKLDEESELIYNLPNVKKNEKIYCVEGPIDSMFLNNSVAVNGTNLKAIEKYLPKDNCVLIYDNQPRNREVLSIMTKAIDMGYSLCIWNSDTQGKDINDLILSGMSSPEVQEYIDQHTYSGLTLRAKFAEWKKI